MSIKVGINGFGRIGRQTFKAIQQKYAGRIDAVKQRAHGRWSEILASAGVDEQILKHRNGPCPLCGGTHACAALAQGDLMVAWQANPGLMPLFVIAAARAAQLAWEAWTGRRVTRWRIGPALWKAGGLFLIGSWALRLAGVL